MKKLCEKIVCKAPRENSGSVSSNRFDFQKDWTICKLLDLGTNEDDFLLLCDYHEDVTVLNKETDPTKIKFYQIKTDKSHNWTIKRLTNRPKGKKVKTLPSILGKLCVHCFDYEKDIDGLFFITNANFNLELTDGTKSIGKAKIKFGDLSKREKEKVRKALKDEFIVEKDLNLDENLRFEITDLSLNDHSNHTKGKLLDYLENIKPGRSYPVSALYKTLFDEVKRRTNYEYSLNDYVILKQKKGISKNFLDNIMCEVTTSLDPAELLRDLSNRLRDENVDLRICVKIKNYFKEYEVERMDATNEYLFRLKSKILKECRGFLEGEENIQIFEMAQKIKQKLRGQSISENIEKITAILFWVIHEELSV